ncbi:Xaa-Pro dipeptidase (plasmid) [Roseovarius sp. THAF8]|uniref:M24 family metallopeptidase n=1 Tax=Roseovarius sp. THAF8 TaxID=2587846 RepID=UPI0012A8BCB2|nr:Xaa-Pro peptidase family protein [Roseovarius sp. THAF8]QFT99900.1 Xaa-Pro dipeptidase [Roseovarius sp. THAF8]
MTAQKLRIEALQKRLRQRELTGALLHISRDIFYYTATSQPGWLFISPYDARLFVRSGLDFALEQSTLPKDSISQESKIAEIVANCVGKKTKGMVIGVEKDVMTVPQYQRLRDVLGSAKLVDVSRDILEQRMIKDLSEIESIKNAARALDKGHEAAMRFWRAGMTELEASAIVEDGHRRAGHEGVYFVRQPDFTMGRGPLTSGENRQAQSGVVFTISGRGLSAAIPAGASRRTIQRGELIIVDIPTCLNGYHGDQSRTYCIGWPDIKAQKLHRCLRAVSDNLIANISPGMSSGEVFERACIHAKAAGIAETFLRFADGRTAHFVGHGVGLDLNEPPFLSRGGEDQIRAGMVLAIELHLCDTEIGMIKLEDMIVVEEQGCHILTLTDRDLISIPTGNATTAD